MLTMYVTLRFLPYVEDHVVDPADQKGGGRRATGGVLLRGDGALREIGVVARVGAVV